MAKRILPLPTEVEEDLKQVLLPICALEVNGKFNVLGTAAVVGALGRQAILITARHTFDYIHRLDQPYQSYSNLLFQVEKDRVQLKQTHMHSFLRQDKNAYGVLIEKMWGATPSDVAIALATLQAHVPADVSFRKRLGIDASPVTKGEFVHLAGFSGMTHKQEILEGGAFGDRGMIKLDHSLFTCSIQDVYHAKGPMGEPDPCFKIDTPINSGMSGAPILKGVKEGKPAICGIAGKDGSYRIGEEAIGSGENALAWQLRTALGITVDVDDQNGGTYKTPFLELIKSGVVDDFGDSVNRASIEIDSAGKRHVHWK
jgi:hypothetical protein